MWKEVLSREIEGTLVWEGHVSDAVYRKRRKRFSEKELVNLTMAVITVNHWNRLAFHSVPGEYQPAAKASKGGTQ